MNHRNEQYEISKKIVIRFLKEMGLLNAWKQYLRSNLVDDYKRRTIYDNEYPDKILGNSRITYFLKKNYNFKIESSITQIFRLYASYNKIITLHKLSSDVYKLVMNDVDADEKTKMIKFKDKVYA